MAQKFEARVNNRAQWGHDLACETRRYRGFFWKKLEKEIYSDVKKL